jgi:hypothetical protein
MHFTHLHENRTMEPVEIVSRREGVRENDGGDEPNKSTL